nr:hypothetical protein Xcnt_02630 [Xanthomonas campestris pv. centellae]
MLMMSCCRPSRQAAMAGNDEGLLHAVLDHRLDHHVPCSAAGTRNVVSTVQRATRTRLRRV